MFCTSYKVQVHVLSYECCSLWGQGGLGVDPSPSLQVGWLRHISDAGSAFGDGGAGGIMLGGLPWRVTEKMQVARKVVPRTGW